MGTRSLTTFIDSYITEDGKRKETKIVTMYRQYDGYPKGHGLQLAEFISNGTMVNGIPAGDDRVMFNGMSCLAAQAIKHFKKEAGGIYLHRGGEKDLGEEYTYDVIDNGPGNDVTIRCRDAWNKEILFIGTAKEFMESYSSVTETV